MEFVPGKFYKRRDGQRAYCIGRNPHLPPKFSTYEWAFALDSGRAFQTDASGKYHGVIDTLSDIIGEWQEPVTVKAYWFGYVSKTSGKPESSAMYDSQYQAETRRQGFIGDGHRVGPIEEITTVVP